MDEDTIIAALVRRAEGGDNQARVRLHRLWLAGIRGHGLENYQEWPRDTAGRRVSRRQGGHPGRGRMGRYDAAGQYIATSKNNGLDLNELPVALRVAVAFEEERDNGWVGDALFERVADRLCPSPATLRKYQTRALRAAARSILNSQV